MSHFLHGKEIEIQNLEKTTKWVVDWSHDVKPWIFSAIHFYKLQISKGNNVSDLKFFNFYSGNAVKIQQHKEVTLYPTINKKNDCALHKLFKDNRFRIKSEKIHKLYRRQFLSNSCLLTQYSKQVTYLSSCSLVA